MKFTIKQKKNQCFFVQFWEVVSEYEEMIESVLVRKRDWVTKRPSEFMKMSVQVKTRVRKNDCAIDT